MADLVTANSVKILPCEGTHTDCITLSFEPDISVEMDKLQL